MMILVIMIRTQTVKQNLLSLVLLDSDLLHQRLIMSLPSFTASMSRDCFLFSVQLNALETLSTKEKATACKPTCANPDYPEQCSLPNNGACVCPDDTQVVMPDNTCADASECGCFEEGKGVCLHAVTVYTKSSSV